jgi:ATP-dependent protease ClpP protease subunit
VGGNDLIEGITTRLLKGIKMEPTIDVVTFVAGINQTTVASLIDIVGKARSSGSDKIVLHISSSGGDLAPAFAAYHSLRSIEIPIEAHNIGNIESAAVLLFLATDVRRAVPHSRFLFHDFHWGFPGGDVPLAKLREHIASLEFDSRRYADIFNERTEGAKSPINISECLNGLSLIAPPVIALMAGVITEPASEPTVPAEVRLWRI